MIFKESELIIQNDKIYHINLHPSQLTENIITVGDPQRVRKVSSYFDKINFTSEKREFIVHGGEYRGKDIIVISTGIGTDNIDIVMNEFDALANIDFQTRTPLEKHTTLNFIRVGTSGAIHPDLHLGDFLVSQAAVGLESLMHFYSHTPNALEAKLNAVASEILENKINPLSFEGSSFLISSIPDIFKKGYTLTCPGFYAPQERNLLGPQRFTGFIKKFADWTEEKYLNFTNMEMETSGIYGLSKVLGHNAISLNAILAERYSGRFHPAPLKLEEKIIQTTLEWIAEKM